MTGFGAAHRQQGARVLAVEARSVNHRFCDVRFNVPRDLEGLAARLENTVRDRVRRGRVDVVVVVTFSADAVLEPAVDLGRAKGYMQAYQQLADGLGRPNEIPLVTIAQCPGVMRAPEAKLDPEDDLDIVREAMAEAIDQLIQMRVAEGQQLTKMLSGHLEQVARLTSDIRVAVPEAVAERQVKLQRRVDELLGERTLDEGRLAQEVALLAERADVTEEVERLESHIVQFRRLLESDDAVGRKMDFLIQEMNREANTVGSKCSHASVAHQVVDLKAELERLREQVQNVE